MAEDCAMLQVSEVKQFLCRVRNVERRFGVRIRVPSFKRRSPSGSEIVIIGISGSSENASNAIEYVEMFSFGEFPSSISYPSELKRVFDDYTWLEVLEILEKVVVRVDPRLCKLVITGKNSSSVSRATTLVRDLISSSTSAIKNYSGTEKLVDVLSANIPEKLKSTLEGLLDLPAHTQAVMVRWVRRAFKLPEKDVTQAERHSDSILMSGDCVVVVADTSADDSVIVIDNPKEEVPVITISDDENVEESSVEREREESVQKAREFARRGLKRKFEETRSNEANVQVARNGQSSASFLSFGARQKKCRTKPDVEVVNVVKPSVPKRMPKQRALRPVVIDGSNIAREHGKPQNVFSCRGILLSVEFFLNRGHTDVVAFVPQFRRKHNKSNTVDQHILEELASKQLVAFTPSRYVAGKTICSYDDRFIVKLATKKNGVILSNDNFRDLIDESLEWRRTIQERLLMYCFVGDILMVPDDPLGRDGPALDEFLSFPDHPGQ